MKVQRVSEMKKENDKLKKRFILNLPVSWTNFLYCLFNELKKDYILKGSAALAYYLTLAIFPLFIFLLSLFPYLPIKNLQATVTTYLERALPGDAGLMFSCFIQEITSKDKLGLLSFGLFAALWSASSGLCAVMDQLNQAYKVTEARSFIKTRLVALALMFVFIFMLISTFIIVLVGDSTILWLKEVYHISVISLALLMIFKWLIILIMISLAFALIYFFGPNVKQKFRFISPGSLFGSALVVVATVLFNVYLENFGSYGKVYGSLGGIIVFMLWLNACGLILIVGAEINALLEHYNPEGKDKGDKKIN